MHMPANNVDTQMKAHTCVLLLSQICLLQCSALPPQAAAAHKAAAAYKAVGTDLAFQNTVSISYFWPFLIISSIHDNCPDGRLYAKK